jgi:hypothetical protein
MFDLGVKTGNAMTQQSILKRSYEMGWNTIAWNVTVSGKVGAAQCRLPADTVIADVHLSSASENRLMLSLSPNQQSPQPLKQLKRITVIVDDPSDGNNVLGIGNTSLKEFDIVAAIPGNSKAFAYLCKFADVDVVSLTLGSRLPFSINKKLVWIFGSFGIICMPIGYDSVLFLYS